MNPEREDAVERGAKAYERVQRAAIGAAPEGMGTEMAYYFYGRVEGGRGYGEETHPPLPCPHFGDSSVDDYPHIIAQAVLSAARKASPDELLMRCEDEKKRAEKAEAERDNYKAKLERLNNGQAESQ